MLKSLLGTAAAALLLSASSSLAHTPDEAAAIHQRALVLDSHADVLIPSTPARYWLPNGGSRADLDHLTRGQVDAIVLSLAVGSGPRDAAGVAAARAEVDEKLAKIRKLAADHPDQIAIATSADEVEHLVASGKKAILISFQNARSLGTDVGQIDKLYADGVRIFAFNHAGHNDWSDSSRPSGGPVAEHNGLSPVGRQAVTRLNDLGILIDVSQLSSDAFAQTLALTRVPVAATHSNVRALVDNTRNLSDAELDLIKANGGVVQVSPFNAYLVVPNAEQRQQVSAIRVRYGLVPEFNSPNDGYPTLPAQPQQAFLDELKTVVPRATVATYVDHIDYIAKRIGVEHVGIGTDFDHGAGVTGYDSQAEAPNVTAELLKRGYTEDQIKAIWGGNFLRVLRAAEAGKAA